MIVDGKVITITATARQPILLLQVDRCLLQSLSNSRCSLPGTCKRLPHPASLLSSSPLPSPPSIATLQLCQHKTCRHGCIQEPTLIPVSIDNRATWHALAPAPFSIQKDPPPSGNPSWPATGHGCPLRNKTTVKCGTGRRSETTSSQKPENGPVLSTATAFVSMPSFPLAFSTWWSPHTCTSHCQYHHHHHHKQHHTDRLMTPPAPKFSGHTHNLTNPQDGNRSVFCRHANTGRRDQPSPAAPHADDQEEPRPT